MWKAKGIQHRVIEQSIDGRFEQRPQKTGQREPAQEQVAGRSGYAPVCLNVAELIMLVGNVVLLKFLVASWNGFDIHAPTYLAPEVEGGKPLPLGQCTPSKAGIPANRLIDESREYIQKVFIRDVEALMDAIHAPQRSAATLTIVTIRSYLGK